MTDWDDIDSDPLGDIRRFCCVHSLRTEHDENGDAICLKCGAVIEVRFNLERFKQRMKEYFERD